jgi:uncharacterized membrane protein
VPALVDVLLAARALAGALLLAFIPGYAWARVLLPERAGWAARLVTSVGLSIALVILGLSVADAALGVRITAVHSVWLSLALTLAAVAIPLARALRVRVERALR